MEFINASMVLEAIIHNIDCLIKDQVIPDDMVIRLSEMKSEVIKMRNDTLDLAKFPTTEASDTLPPISSPQNTLPDIDKLFEDD